MSEKQGHNGGEARPAARPRVLDQVAVLNYATAPLAPTYRAIMEAFAEAKARYAIELKPEEVLARLAAGPYAAEVAGTEDLDERLDQLVAWGNLGRRHDTAAVARIEDFYRRRHVYHLTAAGEAAHDAVRRVEATVGRSGSLQTTMLSKIRDTLDAMAVEVSGASPRPERLVRLLHDLFSAFETLTEEANRFLADLGRHLESEGVAEARFVLHKRAVLAYISRFVEQLRRLAAEIAAAIDLLGEAGPERIVEAASTAADLPPGLEGDDPRTRWVADQLARWEGLATWFRGHGEGAEPTVERLAELGVSAVVELARGLGRLNDRRSRPVDRAADFRTLARWVAAAGSDEEAARVLDAAFGLYSARHFHIAEEDAELAGPSSSWWEAAPVAVPVRLRTHGRIHKAGRPPAAADFSAHKAWIAQARRRERLRAAEALRRFAGRGRLALSDLGALGAAELDLLLELLDEALSAPRRGDGARRVRTADGRLEVAVYPPMSPQLVAIATPGGRLRCLDYGLEVRERRGTEGAGRGHEATS